MTTILYDDGRLMPGPHRESPIIFCTFKEKQGLHGKLFGNDETRVNNKLSLLEASIIMYNKHDNDGKRTG